MIMDGIISFGNKRNYDDFKKQIVKNVVLNVLETYAQYALWS